tara:strand:- start:1269 stop:3707 length:2439 start_codon:yes stop_codon:yes gene_type:complete
LAWVKNTFFEIKNSFSIQLFISMVCMVINASAQDIPNKVSLTEEEQNWIAQHPTITAVNNTAYAPYDFISAGESAGLSIDYLNLLASKVGLKVKYENYGTWSENLKMGIEQKINILPALSETEERKRYFNFSAPYIIDRLVFWGRVGSEKVNDIKDLKDKKIGLIEGDAIFTSYQKHYPDLNYVEFNTSMEALRALTLNEIDIFPHENIPIRFSITQNNIQNIEIIGDGFVIEESKLDQRIAVHKDNPILMNIINKSIAIVSNEEFEAVFDKWIKPDQTINNLDLTEEERAWLTKNNTINVSIDATQAPLEFLEPNGRISGETGAYLDIISSKLGIKFEWVRNSNFEDGLEKIKSKEADLITLLAPTEERKKFLTFTDPYADVSQMIFAPTNKIYASLDALKDKTISQVRGYSITERITQDFPKINIIFASSVGGALDLVETGKADAFVGSLPITSYQIAKKGYDDLVVVGDTSYRGANAFGIRSDLPLLASAVQKAMQSIPLDLKSDISTTWLGYKPAPSVNYGPLWNVLGAVSLFVFFILVWNRKLLFAQKEAEESRQAAQAANQAKSEFLANMSHDLRTPLNAIIGFSETIKEEIYGPVSNKKYLEYNQDIHASGKYLLQLVEDILDISALEANKKELEYETIDISLLVSDCLSVVQKLTEDKNIKLTVDILNYTPTLQADKQALKQILLNLLSNSIKFTAPNGNITIHSEVSGDNYAIHVIDTGYGISEEDIKTITKPFTRAKQSPLVASEEGTGLGLSIVKSLVDLHRGALRIKSKLGEGTTVTVELPLIAINTQIEGSGQLNLNIQ